MYGTNDRITQLTSDAYVALDALVKAVEAEEDTPEDLMIEGEDLIETFQAYKDTLLES